MKVRQKTIATVTVIAVIGLFHGSNLISTTKVVNNNSNLMAAYPIVSNTSDKEIKETKKNKVETKTGKVQTAQSTDIKKKTNVVYDGLTLDELSEKLDRSLNSTLAGKGSTFASYSIELGLDPYLALAIVLEETGCKWGCSELVKQCNNVGGMKGSPGCWGGSYKSFSTLDEGIRSYLENLYYNYYSKGLTTPELINSVYAENPAWASNVNNYINQIKNA